MSTPIAKSMYRRIAFLLCLLPLALPAQATDPSLSEQLLREIREMRQDLQGLTLVAQRVQILLYRVQLQDNSVRRCLSRYDTAKSRVVEIERKRSAAETAMKEWTAKMASPENPGDREAAEGMLRDARPQIEMLLREEGSARSAEAEAANELKAEEAKLNEFQTRLDRMERQLEAYQGGKPMK